MTGKMTQLTESTSFPRTSYIRGSMRARTCERVLQIKVFFCQLCHRKGMVK